MTESENPRILNDSQEEYENEKETIESIDISSKDNPCDKYEFTNECKFTILLNRFNQEREQISKLRNQSIFILTIVGFLISCCIGVMGANWFELSIIHQIPFWMWLVIGFGILSFLVCIIPSFKCLIQVSISSDKYYVNYPTQDMYVLYNEETNYRKNIENLYIGSSYEEVCSNLEKFTLHNLRKNLECKLSIKISAIALPIFFVIIMIIFIWLIIINLDTSEQLIYTCKHCIQNL